jgi:hypothetical protein
VPIFSVPSAAISDDVHRLMVAVDKLDKAF